MNKVLERQLKKMYGSLTSVPQGLDELLLIISDTYNHNEEDKTLLEHSLELSSKELIKRESLLVSTLNSTKNGILVVDTNRKIVSFNQQFIKMWDIQDDILRTRDDKKVFQTVLNQLRNPESFFKKIEELYNQPDVTSNDRLIFKDGRTFDFFSQPQKIQEQEIVGRVWSFQDVTKFVQNEERNKKQMEDLERLNKLMIGRELKMIELKKEIEMLKAKLGS